ncbi:hypothetical protein HOY80DRAFT_966924 [Tuber brumale]|nr:hypothetical protein HOY80DRAFT_966924 [Tuber brumale]
MVSFIVHFVLIIPPLVLGVWEILLLLLCYYMFFCLLPYACRRCCHDTCSLPCLFILPFKRRAKKERRGEEEEEGNERINGEGEGEKKAKNISFSVASTACTSTCMCVAPLRHCVGHSVGLFLSFPPLHRSGQ